MNLHSIHIQILELGDLQNKLLSNGNLITGAFASGAEVAAQLALIDLRTLFNSRS